MTDRNMVPEYLGSLIQLPADTPQEVVDSYNSGFTKAFREFLAKCRAEFPMIDSTVNSKPHVYIAFMALALNEVDDKTSSREGGVVANATNAYIDAVKATIKLAFMHGLAPEIRDDGALIFPTPNRSEAELATMSTQVEQLLERIMNSSGETIVLDADKLA